MVNNPISNIVHLEKLVIRFSVLLMLVATTKDLPRRYHKASTKITKKSWVIKRDIESPRGLKQYSSNNKSNLQQHDENLFKTEVDKKNPDFAHEIVYMWDGSSAVILLIATSANRLMTQSLDKHVETLFRHLNLGPESEVSTPRYGLHCEEAMEL